MAAENIFVNTNSASLGGARCVSLTNNQQEAWKNFVIADQRDLNLYFTDGAGAYVSLTGYSVRAGIGGINKRPTGEMTMFFNTTPAPKLWKRHWTQHLFHLAFL